MYADHDPPGIPGTWTPYQVLATLALLLIGLLLRGRLLDPRRFRAKDVWRPAVTLPAAMVLGAAGVLAGFNPLGGVIAASVVLYALVSLSERPPKLGRGQLEQLGLRRPDRARGRRRDRPGHLVVVRGAARPPAAPAARRRRGLLMSGETYGDDVVSVEAVRSGIWSPFRSLLLAQVLSAVLGLVFWVLVARLVDAHDVGVAAAAISLQALLGIVTVLGHSTTMLQELPKADPARQRTMIRRSLLVVAVSSTLASLVVVAVSPFLASNLKEALGDPIGATAFVLGTAGFAWALVVDDSALGVKRSGIQVWRNFLASSLRFPLTAILLLLGFTDAHVLQVCWVLPLVASIPFTLWRLKLPRGDRSSPPLLTDVRRFQAVAIRNHLLSLCLAAGSQMVPVVAAVTLTSVENAEFAIAWLMATFVFLPPYLLATALFAHGANATEDEFRQSMERTIPPALAAQRGALRRGLGARRAGAADLRW